MTISDVLSAIRVRASAAWDFINLDTSSPGDFIIDFYVKIIVGGGIILLPIVVFWDAVLNILATLLAFMSVALAMVCLDEQPPTLWGVLTEVLGMVLIFVSLGLLLWLLQR